MKESHEGLVLIQKPPGITSFQALNPIKNKLSTSKVGHTGTLDKFASGLLIALTGRLTRISKYFTGLRKSYRAVLTFGVETDTLDPEGEVIKRGAVPGREEIEAAAEKMAGEILQVPPAYSAVHFEGQRAYRLKRAGKSPSLKPRKVEIYRLEILDFSPPELSIEVECSKGTYIRALARDLASAAGSCAYVSSLERFAVGPFRLVEACILEEFDPDRDLLSPAEFFHRLEGFGTLILGDASLRRIRSGVPVRDRDFQSPPARDGLYAVIDHEGNWVAVYSYRNGKYRRNP